MRLGQKKIPSQDAPFLRALPATFWRGETPGLTVLAPRVSSPSGPGSKPQRPALLLCSWGKGQGAVEGPQESDRPAARSELSLAGDGPPPDGFSPLYHGDYSSLLLPRGGLHQFYLPVPNMKWILRYSESVPSNCSRRLLHCAQALHTLPLARSCRAGAWASAHKRGDRLGHPVAELGVLPGRDGPLGPHCGHCLSRWAQQVWSSHTAVRDGPQDPVSGTASPPPNQICA